MIRKERFSFLDANTSASGGSVTTAGTAEEKKVDDDVVPSLEA
jgi:hypothetical protein